MASYFEHKILSGVKAGADLQAASNLHRAVKFDGSGDVVLCGDNELGIGFLQNQPDTGQFAEVAVVGGGSLGVAAATIAAGVFLASDASGDLVAAAAGENVIARSLHAAVSGDHFDVQVLAFTLHA